MGTAIDKTLLFQWFNPLENGRTSQWIWVILRVNSIQKFLKNLHYNISINSFFSRVDLNAAYRYCNLGEEILLTSRDLPSQCRQGLAVWLKGGHSTSLCPSFHIWKMMIKIRSSHRVLTGIHCSKYMQGTSHRTGQFVVNASYQRSSNAS